MQVEQNTSNYVIGTLDARMQTGLDSDDFPHCFVAAQGWIIVYYLKINTANPSTTGWLGKIIDWSLYTNNQLSGNYLSEGLTYIANQLSIVVANSQYYHFQYPNATKLLLAIKHASNGATSTFNIEVPSSFTVKERSWSCYCNSYNGYTFKIDSSVINSTSYIGRNYGGPEIWTTILTPDVFHTVSITCKDDGWSSHYANACLLLIYQ
jgi:hypothetical protein